MSEESSKSKTNKMMDSRKAKAYLIAEFTWKFIILVGLSLLAYQVSHDQTPSMGIIWLLMTVTVVAGFMEAGYMGSQAWLDRYTDAVKGVAQAIVGNPDEPSDKPEAPEK